MGVFNKKRLITSGLFCILIVALLLFISSDIFTYSKYETHLESQNSITTAIYLLNDEYQTVNVKLPDVIPGNNQYAYSFSISNYKDDAHSDTNLKYRIHVRTTTNVNIRYELYNTLNIQNASSNILTYNTSPDSDGTYFNDIYTDYKTMLYSEDKTDNYTLLFTFPDDFKNSKYSGIAELIEINVESNQVLSTDV